MSMPLSPTRLLVCSACGAVLPVGEELLGKKCRCGRCGKISVVTEELPQRQQDEHAPDPNEPVAFNCRVCDTRLAARMKHVGRKAKCPDCGALTAVPAPPKPQPIKKPSAMHGQQYGVWGADDAPSSAELSARQPKFFPIWCRNCDTLMHARPEQVGKKLKCPDCGAKNDIVEPPPPKPKKSALVPDGSEYQLDAAHIPPTRPAPQFVPAHPTTPTAEAEAIRQAHVERPKVPQLPTLQGVLPMLLRGNMLGWSLWLTVVGMLEMVLLGVVMGPAEGIGGLLMVLACYGMAFSLGGIWLSGASALWLAVMTESSEGNDRLHHPPGANFLEWFGDMLYLVTSALLAFAPWWLLCRVLEGELPIVAQGVLQACGWMFTFPLLLLSCLENGSPLELFSPRIFSSAAKLPGLWLLFYIESLVLVGSCLAAMLGAVFFMPYLALLVVPLCVAASLLYFRVLGRFAWWLAEHEKMQSDD